jgi:hypothetical protein
VFGERVPLIPPVFYSAPDEAVTVVTNDGTDDVRVYAKQHGRLSEEIHVPPYAADLITALADLPVRDRADQLRGIGLPFSRVVEVLGTLCGQEVIPAELVPEPIGMPEIPEVEELPERPEADEDWDAPPPGDFPEPVDEVPERSDTEEDW